MWPGSGTEEWTYKRQRTEEEKAVGLYTQRALVRRDWSRKDPWVHSEDINHMRKLNKKDFT